MAERDAPFTFPPGMTREAAERLLKETYDALDTGKLLRRALKLQRAAGWDPPMDLQYVAEARVEEYEAGLGVSLATDVMLLETFDGVDACVDVFEEVLETALMERLEKRLARWRPGGDAS